MDAAIKQKHTCCRWKRFKLKAITVLKDLQELLFQLALLILLALGILYALVKAVEHLYLSNT